MVTWGQSDWGGDSSAVSSALASGVVKVFAAREAFAALKADGSVVTWGNSNYGGDSSAVSNELRWWMDRFFRKTNSCYRIDC